MPGTSGSCFSCVVNGLVRNRIAKKPVFLKIKPNPVGFGFRFLGGFRLNWLKPNIMGFGTCTGFWLVDSCDFQFAPCSIKYTNIRKFVGLIVLKT